MDIPIPIPQNLILSGGTNISPLNQSMNPPIPPSTQALPAIIDPNNSGAIVKNTHSILSGGTPYENIYNPLLNPKYFPRIDPNPILPPEIPTVPPNRLNREPGVPPVLTPVRPIPVSHPVISKKNCGCGCDGVQKESYVPKNRQLLYHPLNCNCCFCQEITINTLNNTINNNSIINNISNNVIYISERSSAWNGHNYLNIVPNGSLSNIGRYQDGKIPLFSKVPTQIANLVYGNGPLITNVEVVTIFSGSYWNLQNEAYNLMRFFDYILSSKYMTLMKEYNINNYQIGFGKHIASHFDNNTPECGPSQYPGYCRIAESDIRSYLRNLINERSIPQPHSVGGVVQTLYFIYLPANIGNNKIEIYDDNNERMCTNICGWHSADTSSGQLFYAVVQYPCLNCTDSAKTTSALDAMTSVSSHELCEAITDPIPGYGWYDSNTRPKYGIDWGEIGDICASDNLTQDTIGGFLVQNMWSNSQKKCISSGIPSKIILSETASGAPAIAVNETKSVFVLAWTGTNRGLNLNILVSNHINTNGSLSFLTKVTLPDSSNGYPAIAFTGSDFSKGTKFFMAWKSNDYHNSIFIKSSENLQTFSGIGRLSDSTSFSPSLAYFNKRLFLAWIANESGPNRNIFIASSLDGETWSNRIRTSEFTEAAPSLSVVNGKLILGWRGYDDTRNLYLAEVDIDSNDKIFLANKVKFPNESSNFAPTIIGNSNVDILAWSSHDNSSNLFLARSTVRGIEGFDILEPSTRYEEQSFFSFPMVDSFQGKPLIAWTGLPPYNINIADLSSLIDLS